MTTSKELARDMLAALEANPDHKLGDSIETDCAIALLHKHTIGRWPDTCDTEQVVADIDPMGAAGDFLAALIRDNDFARPRDRRGVVANLCRAVLSR